MSTLQILYTAIIFFTVTVGVMIVLKPFSASRTQQRLVTIAGGGDAGEGASAANWVETIVKLAAPIAKLSIPSKGWSDSPLRLRFMHAGYRGEAPAMLYFGAKTFLALLFPALAYFYVTLSGTQFGSNGLLLTLFGTTTVGYYLPNVVLSRLVAKRQLEIFENFPDATDLMLVCVESGLGLDAALVKVAEEMRIKSTVLADELHLVNLELRAGSARDKALRNLALRTGVEEVHVFATMLVQADRFGTSIGESLRVFSDDLRTKRKMRAEELAAKIPLKLLFPLVTCIFPSLLLVLLGPAFIQVYRILLPTMAGN